MATYTELRSLFGDGDIIQKIEVAISIAAQTVAAGNDDAAPFDQTAGAHDLRVKWAAGAITDTAAEAKRMVKLVLAANAGSTVTQIKNASDAIIQSNVNASVDAIAAALYGV
jgi:hypothetical protein